MPTPPLVNFFNQQFERQVHFKSNILHQHIPYSLAQAFHRHTEEEPAVHYAPLQDLIPELSQALETPGDIALLLRSRAMLKSLFHYFKRLISHLMRLKLNLSQNCLLLKMY